MIFLFAVLSLPTNIPSFQIFFWSFISHNLSLTWWGHIVFYGSTRTTLPPFHPRTSYDVRTACKEYILMKYIRASGSAMSVGGREVSNGHTNTYRRSYSWIHSKTERMNSHFVKKVENIEIWTFGDITYVTILFRKFMNRFVTMTIVLEQW